MKSRSRTAVGRNEGETVRPALIDDSQLPSRLRAVLREYRARYQPSGWTVQPRRVGSALDFRFTNPLSPVESTVQFEPQISAAELRSRLNEHLDQESEFARLNHYKLPRRRRKLLGGLRWAATVYGWPDSVFREVVGSLRTFRVLRSDEWEWLNLAGSVVLPAEIKKEVIRRSRAKVERPDRSSQDRASPPD